jgi:hypothetical protein
MANETYAHSHNTHREQQDHVKGSSGEQTNTRSWSRKKLYSPSILDVIKLEG